MSGDVLLLRIRAPFAAFRAFQAGVYRPTMPVMPPSAVYGLLLNLAGIETRGPLDESITRIREGLPALTLAIGIIKQPGKGTVLQQLHTYPVGNSGAEFKERTHGAKYWIAPTRREVLTDLDMIVAVRDDGSGLTAGIEAGLSGNASAGRYGLPFAGDNNFLVDRIDILQEALPAYWYCLVDRDDPPPGETCLLSVTIDRTDNTRTRNMLFYRQTAASREPHQTAWVAVNYESGAA